MIYPLDTTLQPTSEMRVKLETSTVEKEPTTERYEKRLVDRERDYSLVSGNV
jgi:hypothetical protein